MRCPTPLQERFTQYDISVWQKVYHKYTQTGKTQNIEKICTLSGHCQEQISASRRRQTREEAYNRQRYPYEILAFFAHLPVCLVGLKVCGGAHYRMRKTRKFGQAWCMFNSFSLGETACHPNKTNIADTRAICEVLRHPATRFVQVKTVERLINIISPLFINNRPIYQNISLKIQITSCISYLH